MRLWKTKQEKTAAALLRRFTDEYVKRYRENDPSIKNCLTIAEIEASTPDVRFAIILNCYSGNTGWTGGPKAYLEHGWIRDSGGRELAGHLLTSRLLLAQEDLARLVAATDNSDRPLFPMGRIMRLVECAAKKEGLSAMLKSAIETWVSSRIDSGVMPSDRAILERMGRLLGTVKPTPFQPGDAWADSAVLFLKEPRDDTGKDWMEIMGHCFSATTATPSKSWGGRAKLLLERIDREEFIDQTGEWFRLVGEPGHVSSDHPFSLDPRVIDERNADALRGLVWCYGSLCERSECLALSKLAATCFKKIPGRGPLCAKVGNACLWSLGNMPGIDGVAQLAILKARVKFGTAQKLIEKSFTAAAEKAGLPRDEIEEMAVPTYGLDDVGLRHETFGEYKAQLVITGSAASEIRWTRSDGRFLKAAPAEVKKENADQLKELVQSCKDIQRMLPAQRDRIDALHLAQKSWPLKVWRERYLDHPLVGVLARRIIWRYSCGDRSADGIHHDEKIIDCVDRAIEWLNDDTRVELWHPICRPIDEVLAWRRWLESHQVRQPFKQAHREVYILTDAERNTRTYSNRFAAHVLRQHQFNALCAARSWKNKLRLLVDAEYPPATRSLPNWNLRAEFWIEGIGEEYGADTNESGVYRRIATDQVRFYPINAAQVTAHAGGGGYSLGARAAPPDPIPLEQIPPLVLSEIMRDVDLFVGVASVGNDPTWQDGGPEGRFRDYWREYAFGDLSETAKTRCEVLSGLMPRLSIADRCTLADKFLVVRGDIRTYKIHLGSGNILMEPNDQYLCIVPGRSSGKTAGARSVFLPFEGDERLSIIISKAFLLAQDTKIVDPTIVRQVRN